MIWVSNSMAFRCYNETTQKQNVLKKHSTLNKLKLPYC